jgi:hypothetical protein
MTFFSSVTIKVRVTSSTAEHVIQGDLNPCSRAMVTHIWFRINYLLFLLGQELCFVSTN